MPVVQTDPRARTRQGRPAGNIPVELSSFVGRDRELKEIKRLLQDAHAITLTGPGGIGKTRLAVRAGRKLARHFPDGVWLASWPSWRAPSWSRTHSRTRCTCTSDPTKRLRTR